MVHTLYSQISTLDLYEVFRHFGRIIHIGELDPLSRRLIVLELSELTRQLARQRTIIVCGQELDIEWIHLELNMECHENDVRPMAAILLQAPSHESPYNILNALPDECLRTIFETFPLNIMDFVDIADVCTRFKTIAKQVVSTRYKILDMRLIVQLPIWRQRSFFRIFGSSIESLKFGNHSSFVCGMIAEFCSKLTELECVINESRSVEELRTISKQLHVLDIDFQHIGSLDLSNWFDGDNQLKALRLCGSDVVLPNREMPHLVKLSVPNVDGIEAFCRANQQIQVLHVLSDPVGLDLNLLLDSFPNITELHLTRSLESINYLNYDCSVQHTRLRTLSLKIVGSDSVYFTATSTLKMFIQHEVPLESLTISACEAGQYGVDFGDVVCQIMTLNRLNLGASCSRDQMIRIARDMNLTELTFHIILEDNGTLDSIIECMQQASARLTHFKVEYELVILGDIVPFNRAQLECMSQIAIDRGIHLELTMVDHEYESRADVSIRVCFIRLQTLSNIRPILLNSI